jgi:thiol-disulfide isomerase/thioredoxin
MQPVKDRMEGCYGHIGGGSAEQVKRGFVEGDAVLKFSAKWCGPCQAIKQRFQEMAEAGAVPCYLVDVDEDQHQLCQSFGVTKLPTFLRLQDGREVGRVEGANLELIAGLLASVHLSQP